MKGTSVPFNLLLLCCSSTSVTVMDTKQRDRGIVWQQQTGDDETFTHHIY